MQLSSRIRLQVNRIGLGDYETYHYDKAKLEAVCKLYNIIVIFCLKSSFYFLKASTLCIAMDFKFAVTNLCR